MKAALAQSDITVQVCRVSEVAPGLFTDCGRAGDSSVSMRLCPRSLAQACAEVDRVIAEYADRPSHYRITLYAMKGAKRWTQLEALYRNRIVGGAPSPFSVMS